MLIERKEELARLMTQEMGKVLAEARGDVQEAIDMTFYMAGEGRRLGGEVVPSELPNKWAMTIRDPIGVVAAITPWNFPVAIPSWKIMPALVAGNTVVIKPASDTPLCAIALVKVLEEAGVPAGRDQPGDGARLHRGHGALEHPDVALISFTGSTDAGNAVAVEAARRLKRVSLEMGGKNAIIVHGRRRPGPGAGRHPLERLRHQRPALHRRQPRDRPPRRAEGTARIAWPRASRSCAWATAWSATTDVGPVINKSQLQRIHGMVQEGQQAGTKLVIGGEIADEGDLAQGAFYRPTLFTDAKRDDMVAQEEIFGPVTTLIPVDSFDEAIEVNNHTKYGLSSSIYTARCQQRLPGDARHHHRHCLHQRRHHRRRNPGALRRHARHRQRPPRSRPGGARHVHRVEDDLRGLQRQAAARADRPRRGSRPVGGTWQNSRSFVSSSRRRVAHAPWRLELELLSEERMPYDFTLMRFPRPMPAGLEALDDGPQAILRGQVGQVLTGIPELQPREEGCFMWPIRRAGPISRSILTRAIRRSSSSVEFDRYAGPADYAAARAMVDRLCNGLRLTIMDDPDAGANPTADAEAPAGGGGLMDKIRGLLGR